jgi:hypothetical protein
MGRRWRTPAARENAPVSADRTQQGGRGKTEGRPEQVIVKRSSPWHWMGHGRDGGHRTGNGRWRAVVELPVRVGRASERARELGMGRKWERGGGQAGRGGSNVAGERAVVGASTAGRSWARG